MTHKSTRRVPGLLIHFGCWWGGSAWLWHASPYGGRRQIFWTIPVSPVYLGAFYLRHGDWQWTEWLGVAGLVVSLALIAATVLALRYKQRWAVWSAHIAIVVYWLVGFALAAEGE